MGGKIEKENYETLRKFSRQEIIFIFFFFESEENFWKCKFDKRK